ncbi:hypothetical protein K6025_02860 [Ehrlichia sp. JZT12]
MNKNESVIFLFIIRAIILTVILLWIFDNKSIECGFALMLSTLFLALFYPIADCNMDINCNDNTKISVQDKDDRMLLTKHKEGIYLLVSCPSEDLKKIDSNGVIFEMKSICNSQENKEKSVVVKQRNIFCKPIGSTKINVTEASIKFNDNSFAEMKGSGFVVSAAGNYKDRLRIKKIFEQDHIFWKSVEVKYKKMYINVSYRKYLVNPEEVTSSLFMRKRVYPKQGDSRSTAFIYEVLLNKVFECSAPTRWDNDKEIKQWLNKPEGKLALYLSTRFFSMFNMFISGYMYSEDRELMRNKMLCLRRYGTSNILCDADACNLLNSMICDILHSMDPSFFSYPIMYADYILEDNSNLSDLIVKDLKSDSSEAKVLKTALIVASYQCENDSCNNSKTNKFIQLLLDLAGCKQEEINDIHAALDNNDIVRIHHELFSNMKNGEIDKEKLVGSARKYILEKYKPRIKPYYECEEMLDIETEGVTLIFDEKQKMKSSKVVVDNIGMLSCCSSKIS